MYSGEPHSVSASALGCRLRAKPKSAIFSTAPGPGAASSRFCGFRSRCARAPPPQRSASGHAALPRCCAGAAGALSEAQANRYRESMVARHRWAALGDKC
jgi:hypothetical protein